MARDFDVGDFIVFQDTIVKVTNIKDRGLNEGNGYGVNFWLSYTSHWFVSNEEQWYEPLHIKHFERMAKQIQKGTHYSETGSCKLFLKEALLWYLARSEYDIRELSAKTNRVCEIPF